MDPKNGVGCPSGLLNGENWAFCVDSTSLNRPRIKV